MSANVDLSEFNKAWSQYLKVTSKSFKDACNNTCFDLARFAYKATGQAKRGDIRSALNEVSNRYPDRTVAEMVVIVIAHNAGEEIKDLETKANALIGTRVGHAGYVKSGLIQAMKDISPSIGKSSFSVNNPSTVLGKGGGTPVRSESTHMVGSVFNDTEGKRNAALVEQLKVDGFQAAIDKVTADKNAYLEKKLKENAQQSGF